MFCGCLSNGGGVSKNINSSTANNLTTNNSCNKNTKTANNPSNISIATAVKYLKVGEKFNITLSENPTTGYTWNYSISNSNILKIIEDKYCAMNNNTIGGGGFHYWIIEGLKKGNATIVFKYRRPWENKSVKTIIYKIYIK